MANSTTKKLASESLSPRLLKSREASQILGISERHLWTLTKTGKIAHVRLGASVRYAMTDLESFIERSRVAV